MKKKEPSWVKYVRVAQVILIIFILYCFIVYTGNAYKFYSNPDRFLYRPSTSDDFFSCQNFTGYSREVFNGTRFYLKENESSDTIFFYYNGNRGSACDRTFLTRRFERYGVSLAFVEYTGYGNSTIKPSQQVLYQDAANMAAFAQSKNYSKTIVLGESLGTAVASYHSSIDPSVRSVILLAPFYSTSLLFKEKFRFYPSAVFRMENYDNAALLRQYDGKLIIIHGERDRNIPIEQAKMLYGSVSTEDKEFVDVRYSRHNDMYRYWDTWRAIRRGMTLE